MQWSSLWLFIRTFWNHYRTVETSVHENLLAQAQQCTNATFAPPPFFSLAIPRVFYFHFKHSSTFAKAAGICCILHGKQCTVVRWCTAWHAMCCHCEGAFFDVCPRRTWPAFIQFGKCILCKTAAFRDWVVEHCILKGALKQAHKRETKIAVLFHAL